MLDLTKCTFKDGVYSGLDEQIAQIKRIMIGYLLIKYQHLQEANIMVLMVEE